MIERSTMTGRNAAAGRGRVGRVLPAVLVTLMSAQLAWGNSPPVVSNVTAAQRPDDSKLVDITYDLADVDGDLCTTWVVVSNDNGVTYGTPAWTITGNVGAGIIPGTGKAVVWDAGADLPGLQSSSFKVRVWANDGQGATAMVFVPEGWFPYQNTGNPGDWVFVQAFLIDKYEVTNESYAQFLNDADPNSDYWTSGMEIMRDGLAGSYTYSVTPGRENHPIRYPNKFDAEAFAAWRSAQEGVTYRLPTEHEWEKAAAWDPVEQHYYIYGFHEDAISCPWCNYNNCVGEATPVGTYDGTAGNNDAKSFYGCYDMSGNVWEWSDTASGVVRGGAWNRGAADCQASSRLTDSPGTRDGSGGFRLVLDTD